MQRFEVTKQEFAQIAGVDFSNVGNITACTLYENGQAIAEYVFVGDEPGFAAQDKTLTAKYLDIAELDRIYALSSAQSR